MTSDHSSILLSFMLKSCTFKLSGTLLEDLMNVEICMLGIALVSRIDGYEDLYGNNFNIKICMASIYNITGRCVS